MRVAEIMNPRALLQAQRLGPLDRRPPVVGGEPRVLQLTAADRGEDEVVGSLAGATADEHVSHLVGNGDRAPGAAGLRLLQAVAAVGLPLPRLGDPRSAHGRE